MSDLPQWVREAQDLPLLFAQVREDPWQDRAILRSLGDEVRVLMVASGGCTAALLAAEPTAVRLHCVDPNPAQLALLRLKLTLLARCDPPQRLALLGHAPLDAAERGARLRALLGELGLPAEILGPPERVAGVGPDQAGRYERTFVALRAAMADQGAAIAELLRLADLQAQAERVAPETQLGAALDAAFDAVFALPPLVALFGEGATANRRQPFARHFAAQTRWALARFPARTNPYLGQVLGGAYPSGHPAPWLSLPRAERLAELTWEQAFMNDALRGAPEGAYDLVHLSNILDWLDPSEARETLALARRALRPGGRVVIRQLNSTLDVRAAGEGLAWDEAESARLHATDRSFFYRALHVGARSS